MIILIFPETGTGLRVSPSFVRQSGSCLNEIAGNALTLCFVALSGTKPFHTFAGNALYPRKTKLRTLFFAFPHLIFSCRCKVLQLQMSFRSKQQAGIAKA
ncbi:hypothetical protein [Brucella sp. 2716]|uniref:hypothetical protein n=1 Tax=Brucella sp. 2716 TaxID=2975052 RepID=UPI00217E060C|nr:hypothetical protein [Brucella sp. 2716]UWF58419.1 hypothetical protein NYO66_07515 [Brucella sp. 2716]